MNITKVIKKSCKNAAKNAEENFKYITLRYFVFPVSKILPERVVLLFIYIFAAILLLFDFLLHENKEFNTVRTAFKLNFIAALRLTIKRFTIPLVDCSISSRILCGKDNIEDWVVCEEKDADVIALRNSGKSYIVAHGHFTRQAYYSTFLKEISPGRIVQVKVPSNPSTGWKEYDRRLEEQLNVLINTQKYCRPDVIYVDVGQDLHAFRKLLHYLREPGNIISMNIDANWEGSPDNIYKGPFAGNGNRSLSTGVIRLAKISGCPVVSCATTISNDGKRLLEWGTPIYVNNNDDEDAQNQALKTLLSTLEMGIGKRPSQYLMSIGSHRFWDKDHWEWIK